MTNANKKIGKILSQYSFINDADIAIQCTTNGHHPSFDLWLYDIAMNRGDGYGQYKLSVQVQYNNEMKKFTKHTTNSVLWCELNNSYELTEDRKNEILAYIFVEVMEANADEILEIEEEILEQENEEN